MKKFKIYKEQIINKPIQEVFNFFNKPENLEKLTPNNLSFKMLTPTPIPMHKNAVIDYRIKLMGIPMYWKTLITEYDPPHFFIDEQIKGPYKLWIHQHKFIKEGECTRVIDEIDYALGFSIFGNLAHTIFVGKQLEKIFNYRSEKIADFF